MHPQMDDLLSTSRHACDWILPAYSLVVPNLSLRGGLKKQLWD